MDDGLWLMDDGWSKKRVESRLRRMMPAFTRFPPSQDCSAVSLRGEDPPSQAMEGGVGDAAALLPPSLGYGATNSSHCVTGATRMAATLSGL